jgi:hypothetical protein
MLWEKDIWAFGFNAKCLKKHEANDEVLFGRTMRN